MRRTFTAVVAALLTLALASPAGAEVDIPTSGRLVYTTIATEEHPDGSASAWPNGVATMAMDASDRQVLLRSNDDEQYYSPSWAPDGQWILFFQSTRTTGNDFADAVGVMRPDGTQRTVLGVNATTPTWAPDGTAIAWSNFYPYGSELYEHYGLTVSPVLDSAFHVVLGVPTVIPLPRQASRPQFSPDGQTIAFVMDRGDWRNPEFDLWTVRRDGSELRRISGPIDVGMAMFQWSPDGRRIAFVGEPDGEPWESNGSWDPHLYVADPDGGNRQKLTYPHVTRFCYVETFSWAPSGEYLAVGGINGCLDGITPQGERLHRLDGSGFGSVDGLSFSPDGSVIYGVARRQGQEFVLWPDLYAFAADGSGHQRLTRDQTVSWAGVQAIDPGGVIRDFGVTAPATSVAVSRRFKSRSKSVVIVPHDDPGHALVAAPLAARMGAPVLLTGSTLAGQVRREVKRLRAGSAVLAGPVSASVASRLRDMGVTVGRLGGRRLAVTAAAVARRIDRNRVVLVPKSGRFWSQASLGSASAALDGVAVLPTGSDTMPRATLRAIAAGVEKVTVVGDDGMVGRSVVRRLQRSGVEVRRIDVRNRYRLSAVLASRAQRRGASVHRPVLASGENWKHSITSGAAAGAKDRVMLLVPKRRLREAAGTDNWLAKNRSAIRKVDLVGGPKVVRARVEAQLERKVRR